MRGLQMLQSGQMTMSSSTHRMQTARPAAAATQLRRRALSHKVPISHIISAQTAQRCSVVAKAGLGGFMQGLAAKLTGARNADDATPRGAYALLEDERAVLIDIRPKGEAGKAGSPDLREFKGKRVVSLAFDYEAPEAFVVKYTRLSAVDEDSLVLLLDSDGSDAPEAAAALAADKETLGQKFYPIRGGAVAWQEAELPWRAGGLLPGLSLASLPTDLDQLAEEFKANPSIGSAALSLAAIIGSATFIINEFDVILEVAGLLGVSVFSIKNLLYAEDREKLLRRMSLFLKDEVGAEAASEELRKLAERALAASEDKAKSGNGSGLGAEVSSWISGWQAKQQEVTSSIQKAIVAPAQPAQEAEEVSELRRRQQEEAMAAAAAAPTPVRAAAPAPAPAAAAPAVSPSPQGRRMQSVQEARAWIAKYAAERAQQQADAQAAGTAFTGPLTAAEEPASASAPAAAALAAEAPAVEAPALEAPAAAAPAAGAPAAEAPAIFAADIERANVLEAREWIAAWQAKQQQQQQQQESAEAPVAAETTTPVAHVSADTATPVSQAPATDGVPANVQEARDWIQNWRQQQLAAANTSAAEGVPANVQEARDWIQNWRQQQLAAAGTSAKVGAADEAGNTNGQSKMEATAAKEVVRELEVVNA